VINTIVVGVDGREGGREAIALAGTLRTQDAQLVLAHAYPYEPTPSRASSRGFEAYLREAAVKLLEEERASAGVEGVIAPVADTSPARALHHCVDRHEADLLVIGSSHHGPVGRVLTGDVAANVLRGASCPVAIAPRGYDQGKQISRIGVGLDNTPESEHALELAVALADRTGAALQLLTVVGNTVPAVAGYGYAFDWTDVIADRRTEAERRLAETIDRVGVPATGEVQVGPPGEHLEALSRETDLLLLGSRGFGPVRRVVLGSTSSHLAHHAGCPILVVPRSAEVDSDVADQSAVADTAG
jgi:nucleotide-binding universal stress UspA family protein